MTFNFVNSIDPIALWGACLSTLLAIREILKSRMKLEVGYNFTGDVDGIGNQIFLRNLTEKPIVITYWQLQWCKKKLFSWEMRDGIEPDYEFSDFVIQPHSSHTFKFSGQQYFDSNSKLYENGAIVLYLLVSGRKNPIKLKVIENA